MAEHVEAFFALYNSDEALRRRVAEAEAAYPGSLEIRESVAEFVLLPIAEELGLPFTIKDLRSYETRLKMSRIQPDEEVPEGDPIEEEPASYWLLDRGWENDPKFFKK